MSRSRKKHACYTDKDSNVEDRNKAYRRHSKSGGSKSLKEFEKRKFKYYIHDFKREIEIYGWKISLNK